jgi:transcriptional regulator with XRE-family HTH domain
VTEDFNRIKPWLKAKLAERGIKTHRFAMLLGTNSATVYRWYSDRFRPTPEMMKRVCECLSRLPVKVEGGSDRYEEVPWSEGMTQYIPREKEGWGRRIRALRGIERDNPEPEKEP